MGFPTGDIKLSANFELNVSKPLDARNVVTNFSDLANISFKYAGMIVFVIATNKHYGLKNNLTTWEVINSGTSGSGGSGGSSSAGNGLTISSGVIQLGGTLTNTLTSINLNNKALRFVNGANTLMNIDEGLLYDNANKESVDTVNRFLKDSTETLSVFWQARKLVDVNGGAALDWVNKNTGLGISSNARWAYLKSDNITSTDKTFQFPNNSGTIALISDIQNASIYGSNGITKNINVIELGGNLNRDTALYGSYNFTYAGLNQLNAYLSQQSVISAQNSNFYSELYLNSGQSQIRYKNKNTNNEGQFIVNNDNTIMDFFQGSGGFKRISLTSNGIGFATSSLSISGFFNTNYLTANRFYQLPNKNGTLAMLSDITGGGDWLANGSYGAATGNWNLGGYVINNISSLGDSSNILSLDVENRYAYDADGNITLNWQGGAGGGSQLYSYFTGTDDYSGLDLLQNSPQLMTYDTTSDIKATVRIIANNGSFEFYAQDMSQVGFPTIRSFSFYEDGIGLGDETNSTIINFSETGLGNVTYKLPNKESGTGTEYFAMLSDITDLSLINNTYYVSVQHGNDSSGQKGNILKPFKSIKTAVNASTAGDVVHVFAGLYDEYHIPTKSYLSIHLEDGVKIEPTFNSGVVSIFSDLILGQAAYNFRITGKGELLCNGQAGNDSTTLVASYPNSKYFIEAKKVRSLEAWGQIGAYIYVKDAIIDFEANAYAGGELYFENCSFINLGTVMYGYGNQGYNYSFKDCYFERNGTNFDFYNVYGNDDMPVLYIAPFGTFTEKANILFDNCEFVNKVPNKDIMYIQSVNYDSSAGMMFNNCKFYNVDSTKKSIVFTTDAMIAMPFGVDQSDTYENGNMKFFFQNNISNVDVDNVNTLYPMTNELPSSGFAINSYFKLNSKFIG